MSDEPRSTRRRVMPPDPAPAPVFEPRRPISLQHMAVVDAWFAGGCLSRRAAMKEVGYDAGSPHTVFNRLEVDAYIRECMAKRQDYMAMSEADIIREYEKIAKASLGDLLEVQQDGSALLDLTSLTPDMRAAISEYQVEAYTETIYEGDEVRQVPVKKFRVKFHDKKAALDSLARIHGMNKDKVEVQTSAGLVEQIAAARKRLQQQET